MVVKNQIIFPFNLNGAIFVDNHQAGDQLNNNAGL